MDRYTLTYEGRARFRRMETRANVDNSVDIQDYEILHFLYTHGSATIEEIESRAALTWDETVNEIATLLNRGYIEGISDSSLN